MRVAGTDRLPRYESPDICDHVGQSQQRLNYQRFQARNDSGAAGGRQCRKHRCLDRVGMAVQIEDERDHNSAEEREARTGSTRCAPIRPLPDRGRACPCSCRGRTSLPQNHSGISSPKPPWVVEPAANPGRLAGPDPGAIRHERDIPKRARRAGAIFARSRPPLPPNPSSESKPASDSHAKYRSRFQA